MKQIIGNRYLKMFEFSSSQESSFFLSNQQNVSVLSFDETFGDNHFCCVCYHSLTDEKQFILSFSSDEGEDSLSFLFWDKYNLVVLNTGRFIYIMDSKLDIIKSFEVNVSLIGLFLTNKDSLLLLEEASVKLVNPRGMILKEELFDLIDNFSIGEDNLIIHTNGETKVFELT